MAQGSVVGRFPERMFGTTAAPVLVLNGTGKIIWINKAFEDTFGYSLEYLENNDRWPFLAANHQEEFLSNIKRVFSGDPQEPFDTPAACSDNTIKTVRWTTMLVDDRRREKTIAFLGIGAESHELTGVNLTDFEQQFRLLFENSSLSMVLVREDMTIAFANKEFEKLTGFSKSEVEGSMRWTLLVADEHDLSRMKEFHRLRRVNPALAPEIYDTKIKKRHGGIRDVTLRVIMVPKTTYSMISLQDVTEKRLAEEAIRESERKYRSLVENMQDTLYRCDLQGNITFASPSGARLLGHDSWEELIGRNVARDYYYEPDERALFLSKMNMDGKVKNYEVRLKRKDGSPVTVLTNSQFMRDRDGTIVGIEGVFRDITERKKAEEKSRLSEEKFMKIFMMMPDCIAITRISDGLIIDVNKGFEGTTGWKRDEAVGRTSLEINFWADSGHRALMVEELAAGKDVVNHEFQFRRRDGAVRSGIYSARTIEIDGESHIIFILQDVTQRKETERLLREKEEQLQGITNNIPGTIFRFFAKDNGEYGVSYVGRRMLDLFDLSTDLEGMFPAFLEHVHEEDRDRMLASIRQAVESVSAWNFEGRFVKPSGEMIWFSAISTPSRHEDRLAFDGLLLDVTRRKQAEEKSRLSEEKFMKVFMMAPDGISITRMRDGLIIDTSMGFKEISGWERSEVVGRTSLELDFWADPAERALLVEDLEAAQEVRQREFQFRRKDGVVRSGIYSARTIEIENETCIVFIMQDITRRKETERILRENEERLRSITKNMPGAICRFYAKDNGEWGMDYASERLVELFGLPEDMEKAFPASMSYIYEEDRDRMLASIREAVESVSAWNFEGRLLKSPGEIKWFHGLATPTRIEDRLVFNGILLDITERKLAEEKTAETEIMYSTLVNSLTDAVTVTDLEGRIKFVSPQTLKLHGFDTPEDLTGRSVMDAFAPESVEEGETNARLLLENGRLSPKEYVLVRRDGSRFMAEVYSSVIRDALGNAKEIIVVTRDISERKRLEEERRQLERQLYQSQKLDAIGQLAGGVAHDFNNILTGIQGNAALMRMEYSPEHPHYRRLTSIEEQVKRGANLTRQLLGVAREGKYEVKTVSPNELIRKSAQFFLETRKEIEADYELQENIYSVEVDAGQVEQVLLNLYINAGHAMHEGGRLNLQTTNVKLLEKDAKAFETKPGDYVKISVSDTGTGMDEETLKKIFEPFFTTKSQEGGTGLGLASAYGIIRNHGGIINAFSKPGQGATFNIYLPASARDVEKVDQATGKDFFSGKGDIMLIDDEPMILDPTSKLLKRLGYTVYLMTSGQEALSVYREKQGSIDLVILDMIMPGMSGSQVLTALKEINPDVKVILSSGYSMQGEVRKVMEMGCCGFIQKPYNFAELSNIVHRVLTGKEER